MDFVMYVMFDWKFKHTWLPWSFFLNILYLWPPFQFHFWQLQAFVIMHTFWKHLDRYPCLFLKRISSRWRLTNFMVCKQYVMSLYAPKKLCFSISLILRSYKIHYQKKSEVSSISKQLKHFKLYYFFVVLS